MLAKDKIKIGSGWYGFIEVISTSTTDISLVVETMLYYLQVQGLE